MMGPKFPHQFVQQFILPLHHSNQGPNGFLKPLEPMLGTKHYGVTVVTVAPELANCTAAPVV